MKNRVLSFVILLFALASACHAQMYEVYVQTNMTEDNQETSYPMIYPIPLLPGAEWFLQFQPIYEQVNLSGATSVYDGSNFTTITLASGVTNTLHAGDAIKDLNVTGNSVEVCQVYSATSTTIVFRPAQCTSGYANWMITTTPGYIFNSGAIFWKTEGTGMSPLGTAEIINTGTDTTAKYFIQSHDKTAGSSSDPGCTSPSDYDLHKAACYETHPTLTNVWPGGIYFQIYFGNNPGACSQTGSIQTHDLALSCPQSFDFKFCTNQTPSQCGVQHFLITPNGAGSGKQAIVFSHPGYRQSFAGETHLYIDSVFANASQYVHRTLIPDSGKTGDAYLEEFAAPSGDGFVKNAGAKNPLFAVHTGTTTNIGYTIHVCADADMTACDDDRIFIPDPTAVGGAKPPANPQKVEQVPCSVDPIMTAVGGNVYEIGPTQANHDFFTLTADQSYPWGSIFRYHNEGAPGSPTTLHNYAEWKAPTNWASFTNDTVTPSLYICGIPNQTSGELPIIDGDHAIGNANVGIYTGEGMLLDVLGSVSVPNVDNYTGNIQPMHNATIANIGFVHANSTYVHYAPGDSGTGSTYGYAMAAVGRPYATQKFSGFGLYASEVSNPIFSDSNANGGWLRNTDLDSWWEGNYVTLYGNNGSYTEHPFYVQDIRGFVIGNTMGGSVAGSNGTGYGSFRTGRGYMMFNRGFPDGSNQTASGSHGDGSVQDYSKYLDIMNTWGPTPSWDGDCNNGSFYYPLCTPAAGGSPAFGGIDTIAAFQVDHFHSLFAGGNAFKMSTGNCATGIHDTNGGTSLAGQHVEFFWNNNTVCPYGGTAMFEMERPPQATSNNNFGIQPMAPTVAWAQNNIWWWGTTQPNCPTFYIDAIRPGDRINFKTNLFHVGQLDPTQTNISVLYGGDSYNQCSTGLNRGSYAEQYTGMFPVEAKIGGWSTANFLTSPAQPYDSTGLQSFASSAASGSATQPSYPMSLYPLAFNAVNASGVMLERSRATAGVPLDMGPADASGGPTLAGITIFPSGPINIFYPGTQQMSATCTYSDLTSSDCSTLVTWSNNGATQFTINSSGLVNSLLRNGTGNVTATWQSLNSNAVSITVTTPHVIFGAGSKIGVGSGSGVKVF